MKRCYCFAGVEICLDIPPEERYEKEGQLAPFRAAAVTDPHVFCFTVREKLDLPKGEFVVYDPPFTIYRNEDCQLRYVGQPGDPYIRVAHHGKEHRVQVKATKGVSPIVILNSLGVEHLVVEAGGVILHCSYIDWKGKAILFTAPSETGKSTQAELWRVHRGAEIINGDRAAMRYIAGNAMAAGIPFSGSSTYCENRELPLAAIVFLGQAPVTTIRRLKGFEAFRRVWEGCSVNSWDREDMTRASDTVTNILSRVPVFELRCTPDESAVIALERALQEV